MGGLSRRAYILNNIRKEESKPILVLDAGAMLFPSSFIIPSQLKAKATQADGLIKAVAQMGYDAFGLAPQDLAAGANFLLQKQKEYDLPWLSMNLEREKGDEPLFTPYLIKETGEIKIGIVAITGPSNPNPQSIPFIDYTITSWEKPLQETLAMLTGKVDMIVLLSSLPENANRKIAEEFNTIHLIIQSGQSTANKIPKLHNNTLITQIGSRGKYVGRLDVQWAESRQWGRSETNSQLKQTKDQLDRVNWQIGRLRNKYPAEKIEENGQYKELLLEQGRLTGILEKIEQEQTNPLQQFSTYRNTFIGLPTSLPEDPEIREIVLNTKEAVNKIYQQSFADSRQNQKKNDAGLFSNLAGWKACKTCHEAQTAFWLGTGHAKAWNTLEKVGQQFNPDCLICHVTLPTYDQETVNKNNMLANLQEDYKGVGCETCHGPAKNHAKEPEKFRPVKPVAENCLRCHTPERDDNFVFSEKVQKIRCPAKGH